jgi:outer membrane murein-binding lipoprotein Lpp
VPTLRRGRSTGTVALAILLSALVAGCGSQASTQPASGTTAHTTVALTQQDDLSARRAVEQIQAAGKACHEHEGDAKWQTTIFSKRLEAAQGAQALALLVHRDGKNGVVYIPGREATLGEYLARAEFALEGCATMEGILNSLRRAS